jgi:cell wall-associated NlpC family hydrolase
MKSFAKAVLIAAIVMPLAVQAQTKLGQLGQALKATSIYSKATTKSRVYYRVPAYEYLIVKPAIKGWVPVVMEDGRTGYISASKVAVLPWEVTRAKPAVKSAVATRTAGSRTSRSGSGVTSDAKAGIANYALNYVGTPYKWGGNDLNRGIDCSAFVQQLYGKIGVDLPRTAAEQALVGQKIMRLEDLVAGDRLYFWDKKRGKIGHTGIYMGNGYFVHSSTNNRGVATDDLRNQKWRNMLVSARR